jgi:hypothetical protein
MNDLYAHYSRVGFSNMKYRKCGPVWGWFTTEAALVATQFVTYTEGQLVIVVPYAVFCAGHVCIYVDNYCLGQKTATGKISEAYKWEERLAGQGFVPELILKIKDFLYRENKK